MTRLHAMSERPPSEPIEQGAFPEQTLETFPAPLSSKKPIAVIGAGFSGTIAALQLIPRLPNSQRVLLCERAPDFARGIAYATGDYTPLLNVRAANMSAIAEDPSHFEAWLRARADLCATAGRGALPGMHETPAGVFVSRVLYGDYLRSILDQTIRHPTRNVQLCLLPEEVTDLEPAPSGGFLLHTIDCRQIEVTGVVLANGNLPADEDPHPAICRNVWSEKTWRTLMPDRPVAIIGTGLTMVDVAIRLRRLGFNGPLIALSRRGLLPASHAPSQSWPTPQLTLAEELSVARLTRRLRQEIAAAAEQDVGWRSVIDSMRPITASLWLRLPAAERRRFLRHVRRYWDIHRHRMAPQHAEQIAGMIADGSLHVRAGRVRSFDAQSDGVVMQICTRDGGEENLAVQRVILAIGLEPIGRTRDTLMQRLLDRGLVRLDSEGIALEVTDGLKAVGADGQVSSCLWALGPLVRGVFWECTAVPDIRVQASHLAVDVAAWLHQDAPW